MVLRDLKLNVGTQSIILRGDGSAFIPDNKSLLISDVHLGKAETFQKYGKGIPIGSDEDSIERIGRAIKETDAETVVVCGDLFHAPALLNSQRLQDLLQQLVKDIFNSDHPY